MPSSPESFSETSCVAGAAQATLLLDVRLRPLLSLLMHAPGTATTVAEQLNLTVKRAHYLLTLLERAGVARIVAHEPRRGRAIRHYAAASRWFIPFEVTGAETLEAFLGEQVLPRMAGFVRLGAQRLQAHSPDWGYWLELDVQGTQMRLGDQRGPAQELFRADEPFLLKIGTAHLSRDQAGALQRRLAEVLEEFGALETPESPEYTVGLMLVRGNVG